MQTGGKAGGDAAEAKALPPLAPLGGRPPSADDRAAYIPFAQAGNALPDAAKLADSKPVPLYALPARSATVLAHFVFIYLLYFFRHTRTDRMVTITSLQQTASASATGAATPTSSSSTSPQSASVDLHVTNLDQSIGAKEMKSLLIAVFKQHVVVRFVPSFTDEF